MGSVLRGGRRQIPCYRAINREIFLFLRRFRRPFDTFTFVDNDLAIPPVSITGKSAPITGNFWAAGRRLRAPQVGALSRFTVLENVIAGIRYTSFRETMQRSGWLLNQTSRYRCNARRRAAATTAANNLFITITGNVSESHERTTIGAAAIMRVRAGPHDSQREPAYRPEMDGDSGGIALEPYRG